MAETKQAQNQNNGHKVAIIGSGPAGIACATELAKKNYDVTIFEAYDKAGGILRYGIPEYRLPKTVLDTEIEKLEKLNVKLELNTKFGKDINFESLEKDGYEAIFLGVGFGKSKFMNIAGENLDGVILADEFLEKASENENLIQSKDVVAVVGGGNVAMDSARTAVRLGAKKVYVIYRRSIDEIPARKEELVEAEEENIDFKFLTNPVEISGDGGKVCAIKCIKMELGEPDEKGRRRPVEIKNSEFEIAVDAVIMSIGAKANELSKNTDGLEFNSWGGIVVNENGETTKTNVFAGGDIVTGAATVVDAIAAGKLAANSIDKRIMEGEKC